MSYFGTSNFYLEVAKGNVFGHALVHKFGRNDAIPNGSWAHVSQTPLVIANFRQSAIAMRVKAGGNAADTAAGAGAREVTIQGIDSNLVEISEAVATAGASASSATSATFWRVHRSWVSAAGTYSAANTADIVIEDSGSGADFLTIAAGEGQSQIAGFTIPAGKTGYLVSVHTTVSAGLNKTVNIKCVTRENIDDVSAPFSASRIKLFWDGLDTPFVYRPYSPELAIPEKTDIWFEAYGDGGVSEVSIDFELLLVDD